MAAEVRPLDELALTADPTPAPPKWVGRLSPSAFTMRMVEKRSMDEKSASFLEGPPRVPVDVI